MKVERLALLFFVGLGLFFAADTRPRDAKAVSPAPKLDLATALKQIARQPLRFEENVGQAKNDARFVARRSGASLFLSDAGARLSLATKDKHVELTLSVDGGRDVKPVASAPLATKTNYLIGRDKTKWHPNVANYAKVTYPNVLDGVDVVYHGEEGQLEYDFVVAPGADVAHVAMNIGGTAKLALTAKGDLELGVNGGTLVQPRPRVYQQDANGKAHDVDASYRLVGNRAVGFEVASYDHARPLVIDPVIGYSTYLGGSDDDQGNGIAADSSGNAFVVGTATFEDFTPSKSISTNQGRNRDMYIAKLSSDGQLAYYTYVGGDYADYGFAITLDSQNLPVVTGYTQSDDFPTTNGTTYLGPNNDSFLVQLNAAGDGIASASLVGTEQTQCTYPSDGEGPPSQASCPTVDDQGNAVAVIGSVAYVVGYQASDQDECVGCSTDFPGSSGIFVTEITLGGSITESRFIGGVGSMGGPGGMGVAADAQYVYVTGSDYGGEVASLIPSTSNGFQPSNSGNANQVAFLVKLNRGTGLTDQWGTYYFDTNGTYSSQGNGVALGANGRAFITGQAVCGTKGTCAYTTRSAFQSNIVGTADAFIAQFDTTQSGDSSLVYATFLGGNETLDGNGNYGENASAIAIDALGDAYIVGGTDAPDFPTKPAIQLQGGTVRPFLAEIGPTGGSLVFSTVFGGTGTDSVNAVAVNNTGVYVAGSTTSADFPVVNAYQSKQNNGSQDAFIVKLTTPPLDLEPASSSVAAGASLVFTASGGAGTGYIFGITTNGSGGTINAGTGAYTAGTQSGTDIVAVTDLTGNSVSARVVVTANAAPPDLVISPTDATVTPRGSLSFSATGGTPPYFFDFLSNASNGTIGDSGLYVAGMRGSVIDTVRVTDQAGVVRQATVRVGPAIAITPNGVSVAAGGTTDFRASGGGGGAYQWSASAGTITSAGSFTAPTTATAVTITVRDTLGNTASASVSVGGAIVITPGDATTYPHGTVHFQALGGSGEGFKWILASGASGGMIDVGSGDYTAGAQGNTQDAIEVTDSNGNKASAVITIGPGLSINPPSATANANAQVSFSAAGGSGAGYVFAMISAPSGGSISQQGIYTAGKNGGNDLIKVTDSAGNTAQAQVTAAAAPASTGSSSSTSSSSGGGGAPSTDIPDVDAGDGTNLNISAGKSSGSNSSCTIGRQTNSTGRGAILAILFGFALVTRRQARRSRR